jgi:hypothetical protein
MMVSLQQQVIDSPSFISECVDWFNRLDSVYPHLLGGRTHEVPTTLLRSAIITSVEAYYQESKKNSSPSSSPSLPSASPTTSKDASVGAGGMGAGAVGNGNWWPSVRHIYACASFVGQLMKRTELGIQKDSPKDPKDGVKKGDENERNVVTSTISILHYVLDIICRLIAQDIRGRPNIFSQRPYHQFLVCLFEELNDPVFEPLTYSVLCALSGFLMSLRPLRHPGFVFSWIDLIAHRHYMPKMLNRGAACWGIYRSLILDLFCFLEPFLSNVELNPPLRLLYKGSFQIIFF